MQDAFASIAERAAARGAPALSQQGPVWLFGAGAFGKAACGVLQRAGYQVAGFVETAPRVSHVLGLPLHGWADLPREGQLAVTIFNRDMAFDALASLAAANGRPDALLPTDVYELVGEALGWRYWLSRRGFLLANAERLAAVAERMADEESRECLRRLYAFRLGLDPGYASHCTDEAQYFNALTLPALRGRPFRYVDGGAYNGDTLAELVALPGVDCEGAYLLEPDPENYRRLVGNAGRVRTRSVCLPLALSDRSAMLSFAADQGEASRLGDAGGIQVAAVALDDLLPNENVGFLKLDVEGAEAQALEGARRLIGRARPVLALSLYHHPQDLWALPELLFTMCGSYRFHVRQHRFNSFDCVLYAVPQ